MFENGLKKQPNILVDYSSSSGSSGSESPTKKVLFFDENEQLNLNRPSLVKNFHNKKGNHQFYIYSEFRQQDLEHKLKKIKDQITASTGLEFFPVEGLKISFSKPLFVSWLYVDSFKSSLRDSVLELIKSDLITIKFGTIECFLNDSLNKAFLCLTLDTDSTTKINKLINKIDEVVDKYNQPKYYTPSRPHISFGYIELTGEDDKNILSCLKNMHLKGLNIEVELEEIVDDYRLVISKHNVVCKVDNSKHSIFNLK